ncbi:MAG TPA: sulfatase, partial [Solibacterales bacterium]|nr:sulfatase [Bryobacterales bacterium]
GAAAAGIAAAPAILKGQRRPPNLVLIFCDDLGYGDLSCYGGSIPTPRIDSLARDGVRFTHFVSANAYCSPSRAGLLTGRYPTRVSVPRVLGPKDTAGLPLEEATLAELLKPAGYRTACVGKWHLGHLPAYLPTARGFDSYFGIPYSNDMDPPVLLRNTETVEARATQETLTQRYTEEAVRFIEGNAANPFFLYLPHTFPHIPLFASDRFRGKSPHGIYGDVLAELDWSTGVILDTLRRRGLDENTMVLFSSDNGPWYQGSPGRLRGRKGTTYEGGFRVPFLARWPGRWPARRVREGIFSAMDIMPTVCAYTGAAKPKAPLDGIDARALLEGKADDLPRDPLLYFENNNLQCARWKQWKLHVARHNNGAFMPAPPGGRRSFLLPSPELYDVVRDPDESYDVAARHPEIVQELRGHMDRLMAGFPEVVRRQWEADQANPSAPVSTGAVARPRA